MKRLNIFFVLKVLLCLVFLFLTFNVPSAFATSTTVTTPKYGGGPASQIACKDASQCTTDYGTTCNNGPAAGNSGGCGDSCYGGASWSKYDYISCAQTSYDPVNDSEICQPYFDYTSPVCSTADKCDDGSGNTIGPYLAAGSCSCTVGNIYKTCCNGSNVSGSSCVQLSSDTTNPPYEGACGGGATQVMCGVNCTSICGYDGCSVGGVYCTSAACGNNACQAIFPTTTPTSSPSPSPTNTPTPTIACQYGTCTPGSAQTCSGGSATKTCDPDPNNPGQYCWSGPNACTPARGGSTCDVSTGTCKPSLCINNDPCTTQGDSTCTTDGTGVKTCFNFGTDLNGNPVNCWVTSTSCSAGQTCSGTPAVCQNNTTTYNCQSNACTAVSGSGGTYSTLSDCNNNCSSGPTPPPICGAGFCPIIQRCTGPTTYSLVVTVGIPSTNYFNCGVGYHCVDNTQALCSGAFNCPVSQCVADPPAQINGQVFMDYNGNKRKDAGESTYNGSLSISNSYSAGPYAPAFCTTYPNGIWPCDYYYGGSNYPNGYCASQCNKPTAPGGGITPGCFGGTYNACTSYCVSNPSSCPGGAASFCNSYCTQGAQCCGGSYATCSSWWCGSQSTCGTTCTGTNTIPAAAPTSTNQSGGSYTITGAGGGALTYGTYTVSANIPGAVFGEPTSGNSFTVTAGSSQYCTTGGSVNASCNQGSINNLNFGIKGNSPWIQSQGLDLRNDSGFSSQIPANATCGAYASLPGAGGSVGIIYSGDNASNFGSGQASSNNWIAGSSTYPESYSPTRPSLIRTSYNYLLSVAKGASITPIDISNYCGGGGLSTCVLPNNLPNGLYIANGNLTIIGNGSYTFPANKNFVILVNGDLTIKTKILVPNGSTATFSSSGNTIVDKSVGEASASSTASDIEGFYSADKSFILDGSNNCSSPDTRLNVAGSVVVNANLSNNGTFQNNRNLCAANDQCPAFFVKERPDFVLNAPDFIKHPSYVYQETAP